MIAHACGDPDLIRVSLMYDTSFARNVSFTIHFGSSPIITVIFSIIAVLDLNLSKNLLKMIPIAAFPAKGAVSRDIRMLDFQEVCSLREWLQRYMRLELENPLLTDSKLLLPILVRSSREFESDFGVFGIED